MIGWLGFVVVALASYRLARIVAVDSISGAFRDRVYRWAWDDENGEVVQDFGKAESYIVPVERAAWRTYVFGLVSCPVCIGVWITAGLYSAWRWWDWTPVRAFILIFAAAGVQCFLATRDGA